MMKKRKYIKRKIDLKEFVKENFNFKYSSIYAVNSKKEIRNIIHRAFENYKAHKEFECNEEKLLKIITLGIYNAKDIQTLCKYLSDKDLDEVEALEVNITPENITEKKIKEEIKKIITYRSVKDKNKFSITYLLLNALLINLKIIDNLLKDNELTIDKIKIFEEEELRYIAKKPFLIGLIKKVPLKTLQVIKQQIKANKGEQK